MSIYRKFAMSKDAESERGVILDYGDGGRIRIRRAGGSNRAFQQLMEEKMKPLARQIQMGVLDDSVARAVMTEVYAKTVIIGWEDLKNERDEPIEFTPENAIKVFTDLPELFSDIQRAAQDRGLFLEHS